MLPTFLLLATATLAACSDLCFPDRFHGSLTVELLDGHPHSGDMRDIAVDFNTGIVAIRNGTVLVYIREGIEYVVGPDGTCRQGPANPAHVPFQCIPSSATKIDERTYMWTLGDLVRLVVLRSSDSVEPERIEETNTYLGVRSTSIFVEGHFLDSQIEDSELSPDNLANC